MRKLIREFVQICSDSIPTPEPIYEFGARQAPGQEEIANLRPLLAGKLFIGADNQPGPGVDTLLDLENIKLNPNTAGTILILDTLEHVEHPRKAIQEAYRILTSSGVLIISSVMNFEIHPHPHDYWRFTPEGFQSLLSPFAYTHIESIGKERFPHTVIGIAWIQKPNMEIRKKFIAHFPAFKKRWYQGW